MITLTNYTRKEFIEIFKQAKARKAEWQKNAMRELNEMSDRISSSKIKSKEIFG